MATPAPTGFAPPKTCTLDEAKVILTDVNAVLAQNKAMLDGIKVQAGQDVMMVMMMLLPQAAQVMGPTLSKHGFPADPSGVFNLIAALAAHKEDAEVADKLATMKAAFMTPELEPMLTAMLGGMGGAQ